MAFRIKKSLPRNNGEAVPQKDATERWRLNFGLAPGPARARMIRKIGKTAGDKASVKDDSSPQS